MKSYVFSNRRASGYKIENTIPSSRKPVEMGAWMATEIKMTKDHKLCCSNHKICKMCMQYYKQNQKTNTANISSYP